MKLSLPFLNLSPEMVNKLIDKASMGEKKKIEQSLETLGLAIHNGDFATASEIANELDVYRVPLVGKFVEWCIYGASDDAN